GLVPRLGTPTLRRKALCQAGLQAGCKHQPLVSFHEYRSMATSEGARAVPRSSTTSLVYPNWWPRTWTPSGTTQSVETASESPAPLVRGARRRSIQRVPAPFGNGAGTVVTLGMYGSRLASTTVSRSVSNHGRRRTTPSSSGGSG